MAFIIEHAPKTEFDIAGEYFRALHAQRAINDANQRRQEDLGLKREAIAAEDRRAAAGQAGQDRRHRERLDFDREQATSKQLAAEEKAAREQDDADSLTKIMLGEFDGDGPDGEGAAEDAAEGGGMGVPMTPDGAPDFEAMANGPVIPTETRGMVRTPYGVSVPVVRPRSPAGARLILDALNHQLDAHAKQAAKDEAAAGKRTRAAQLQQATGVGMPTPPGVRAATPEEGGYLLANPNVQTPGEPGMEFQDPADVMAVAHLQQSQQRIDIASQRAAALEAKAKAGGMVSEEEVDQHAQDLMTIRPSLSPAKALALARSRLNHIPVSLENVKDVGPTETEEYKQLNHDRNATYAAVKRMESKDDFNERRDGPRLEVLKNELATMDAKLGKMRTAGAGGSAGPKDDVELIDRAIQELGPDATDAEIEAHVLKAKGGKK